MPERRRRTGTFEAARKTGTHDVVDRLFVYGTMREGQTARSLIANQITRCVGARASGALYAFSMGYPGLSDFETSGTVVGEVVWLTELAATFGLLDAYEGTEFVRVVKQVVLDTGETIWAWVYILAEEATSRLGTKIEDGDWVRYWTEQA
jgi:gamma-glutamylcyclotransferase (GGCT)/AIG2-like uncharacterized protein YtfP